MASKVRRQPKSGELMARRNYVPAPYVARPETSRENTDISQWRHKITFCDARAAYGSQTWRVRGGMVVGAGSSGATSGTVPQAFARHA